MDFTVKRAFLLGRGYQNQDSTRMSWDFTDAAAGE